MFLGWSFGALELETDFPWSFAEFQNFPSAMMCFNYFEVTCNSFLPYHVILLEFSHVSLGLSMSFQAHTWPRGGQGASPTAERQLAHEQDE